MEYQEIDIYRKALRERGKTEKRCLDKCVVRNTGCKNDFGNIVQNECEQSKVIFAKARGKTTAVFKIKW